MTDCGKHGQKSRDRSRRLCGAVAVFLFLVLLVILLVWAILRPTKPKFVLQDATVYALNVSSPNILTSNFQVTISSRNPNDRIGVYYDRLDIYAQYRNQQITLRTSLPRTYQGHNEVIVWSPFVYGTSVPVAPYNALSLDQDRSTGTVMLMIKIDGRVRWKVGAFISGHYHLNVRCPAYITFGDTDNAVVVPNNNAVKYQLVQACHVTV